MITELERMDMLRLTNAEANKITRDCLKRAMGRLLREKEFQKISVTELVTVAGVSRTAFYRNYDSREALLEDVSTTVRETVAESILNLRNAGNPADQERIMIGIFQELKMNSTDLVWLLDIGRSLLSHEQIESLVAAENEKTQYVNAACLSAVLGIMTRWLKAGMKESPEEMGKMSCNILRTMREAL